MASVRSPAGRDLDGDHPAASACAHDIRSEVVDAATRTLQTRGTNGLSYGSIAQDLGIRASSIHHHFPGKSDLLVAVVAHYRARFREQAEALAGTTPRDRLEADATLFLAAAQRELMCLCAAAAGDREGIDAATRTRSPPSSTARASVFTQAIEAIDTDQLKPDLGADGFAKAFVAALEGALLLARVRDEPDVIPRRCVTAPRPRALIEDGAVAAELRSGVTRLEGAHERVRRAHGAEPRPAAAGHRAATRPWGARADDVVNRIGEDLRRQRQPGARHDGSGPRRAPKRTHCWGSLGEAPWRMTPSAPSAN